MYLPASASTSAPISKQICLLLGRVTRANIHMVYLNRFPPIIILIHLVCLGGNNRNGSLNPRKWFWDDCLHKVSNVKCLAGCKGSKVIQKAKSTKKKITMEVTVFTEVKFTIYAYNI